MKYHSRDWILFLFTLIQWSLLLLWARSFEAISLPTHLAYLFFFSFIFYFNPIVVTHNFLHTPFFKKNIFNKAFAIFNSMNLGLPQILYKYHHLNHHRHNNSLEDPSSTYLYGKNGKQEHWISYSAFSLFRDGTQIAFKETLRKKEGSQLIMEIVSTLVYLGLLLTISWKFFLTIYLPLFFTGWFLAHLENYFEHYKASNPSNRFGNAVSFYGSFYNLIMFNEGYHQEHHISPQEHWSLRPLTKLKYQNQMKNSGAFEAKFPPLFGMLEK